MRGYRTDKTSPRGEVYQSKIKNLEDVPDSADWWIKGVCVGGGGLGSLVWGGGGGGIPDVCWGGLGSLTCVGGGWDPWCV